MGFSVVVLPGDGVGPEITAEGVKVLKAIGETFGHRFEFRDGWIGVASFEKVGEALPQKTIDLCKECDAILFGAVGEPRYEQPGLKIRPELGYGIIRLRKTFGLFANLRPVHLFSCLVNSTNLKPEVVNGIDIIIVRELTGGIYFAEPKQLLRTPEGRSAVDTLAYTEEEIKRILRVGLNWQGAGARSWPRWINFRSCGLLTCGGKSPRRLLRNTRMWNLNISTSMPARCA